MDAGAPCEANLLRGAPRADNEPEEVVVRVLPVRDEDPTGDLTAQVPSVTQQVRGDTHAICRARDAPWVVDAGGTFVDTGCSIRASTDMQGRLYYRATRLHEGVWEGGHATGSA